MSLADLIALDPAAAAYVGAISTRGLTGTLTALIGADDTMLALDACERALGLLAPADDVSAAA